MTRYVKGFIENEISHNVIYDYITFIKMTSIESVTAFRNDRIYGKNIDMEQ